MWIGTTTGASSGSLKRVDRSAWSAVDRNRRAGRRVLRLCGRHVWRDGSYRVKRQSRIFRNNRCKARQWHQVPPTFTSSTHDKNRSRWCIDKSGKQQTSAINHPTAFGCNGLRLRLRSAPPHQAKPDHCAGHKGPSCGRFHGWPSAGRFPAFRHCAGIP